MTALHAAVLGLVQGATEFLPVSSSGHLILVPALLGWPDQGLAFDAAVHLGTVLALLIFFGGSSVTSRAASWPATRRSVGWAWACCWPRSPRESPGSRSSR